MAKTVNAFVAAIYNLIHKFGGYLNSHTTVKKYLVVLEVPVEKKTLKVSGK